MQGAETMTPGAAAALEGYHARMLPTYLPVRLAGEQLPGVAALGTDDCRLWREALAALPRDRKLLLELGADLLQQGREGEALAFYRWLADVFPDDPLMPHNLGSVLQGAGDLIEAEAWLRRALAIDPLRQDTTLALAQVVSGSQPQAARELLRMLDPDGAQGFAAQLTALALDLAPEPAGAEAGVASLLPMAEGEPERFRSLLSLLAARGHLALALSLSSKGPPQPDPLVWEWTILQWIAPAVADAEPARALRRRLEEQRGDDPALWLVLAGFDRAAGRLRDAEAHFQRVLALDGDRGRACAELAGLLFSQGRLVEARQNLEESLAALPLRADTHLTRGLLALALGDPEDALAWFRTSLRLLPRSGRGLLMLARLTRLTGDLPAARALFEEAQRRRPDDETRADLGMTLLQLGIYPEGWRHYEARFHASGVTLHPPIGMPRWDGESPLDHLVIVAEQGAGDLFQFLRYVPVLNLAIPEVSILADPRLRSLLLHAGLFTAVYSPGEMIRFQGEAAWLPLLSVPGLLGVSPDFVLIEPPYLQPRHEAVTRWTDLLRQGLRADERLVALHWQGNPTTEVSSLVGRSFPLETLAPLAALPGFRFVSLQKGFGAEQLAACSFRDRFIEAQDEVDRCWDFAETTGLLQACDLLITSDSAVAHLAGAMDLPVWLLLQHIPDWRWGLEGERSPWYPRMRLFRQPRLCDWDSVVRSVRDALLEGPVIA